MATDPRLALVRLVDALENFHEIASSTDDPEASAVFEAADRLSDAYIVYDDVMFTQYGVELPFDLFDDDADDIDDESEEDEESDEIEPDDDLDDEDFDEEDEDLEFFADPIE